MDSVKVIWTGSMEVPIAIVSLGASRDQTIVVEDPIHGPKRALLSA